MAPQDYVKVALCIGIADYDHCQPLKNPVNDANDMAESLEKLGFDVTKVVNPNFEQLEESIDAFCMKREEVIEESEGQRSLSICFISGHGASYAGANFILPTNFKFTRGEKSLKHSALNLNELIDISKGADEKGVDVFILDCCRNNPIKRSLTRNTNKIQGLAPIEVTDETLIAFSTSPNEVASDGMGDDRNSPYTHHLLENLKVPNLPIERIFKKTRIGVKKTTDNKQVPWENSNLCSDIILIPQGSVQQPQQQPVKQPQQQPVKQPQPHQSVEAPKPSAPQLDDTREIRVLVIYDEEKHIGELSVPFKTVGNLHSALLDVVGESDAKTSQFKFECFDQDFEEWCSIKKCPKDYPAKWKVRILKKEQAPAPQVPKQSPVPSSPLIPESPQTIEVNPLEYIPVPPTDLNEMYKHEDFQLLNILKIRSVTNVKANFLYYKNLKNFALELENDNPHAICFPSLSWTQTNNCELLKSDPILPNKFQHYVIPPKCSRIVAGLQTKDKSSPSSAYYRFTKPGIQGKLVEKKNADGALFECFSFGQGYAVFFMRNNTQKTALIHLKFKVLENINLHLATSDFILLKPGQIHRHAIFEFKQRGHAWRYRYTHKIHWT